MEKYYLPVLFTEIERENYVRWALKKEKVLIPTAIITILIDLFVTAGTVFYLLYVRKNEPYFSMWLSVWGPAVMKISYFLALFLTVLIIKPLDLILDYIYEKPDEPKMITLTPTIKGVCYIVNRHNDELMSGIIKWKEWDRIILLDSNEIIIQNQKYKIGANTIETIYPKSKQKLWMDRPDEKIKNSISLKIIDRNFKGYLASLEVKRKEEEWIKQNL